MGPALRPVLPFRGSCAARGGGAPPARGRDGTPVISAKLVDERPGITVSAAWVLSRLIKHVPRTSDSMKAISF
jgi:hypothetical protein